MRRAVNASTQRALSEHCMERCRWRRHWIRRSSARSAQAATTVPAREHAHIESRRERSQTRAWLRALRPDAVPLCGRHALREWGERRRRPNLYRIAYSCRTPLHHTRPVTRRLQSSTALQYTALQLSIVYNLCIHPSDFAPTFPRSNPPFRGRFVCAVRCSWRNLPHRFLLFRLPRWLAVAQGWE